jgi:DNA mismatch repair ATPase MutL
LIDVNVHPRKEEVKFISPGVIFDSLYKAIYSKLNQAAESQRVVYKAPPSQVHQQAARSGAVKSDYQPENRPKPSYSQQQQFVQSILEDKDVFDDLDSGDIWQVGQLYLIVRGNKELIIYDQHAAEEKILFEQFKQDFIDKRGDTQELLFEEKIELDPEDLDLVENQKEALATIGFELKVEDSTAKIKGIPVILEDKNIGVIFRNYLDELKSPEEELHPDPENTGIDENTLTNLAYLACRSAVKQGDKLSPAKRREIIDKLNDLGAVGMTCPHGRPTFIKISLSDLNKRFHRN